MTTIMALFDQKAFNSLIDGDLDLFAELLQLFRTDWPVLMDDIQKAIDRGDTRAVELLAHRLKGTIRNFFARETAEIAGRIEDQGRVKNLVGLTEPMTALQHSLKLLTDELARHLASLS